MSLFSPTESSFVFSMSRLSTFLSALALLSVCSAAEAQLLPSTITGSVTAAAQGYNTGPGPMPTISETLSVPASGTASAQVYATPFSVGAGTLGSLTGGFSSASVNLGAVNNTSVSLSAAANFGYVPFTTSDGVVVFPSYSFSQTIDVVSPVDYSLQMSVTRPVFAGVTVANGPETYLAAPSETFTGPGTSITLSGEYYLPTDPSNPAASPVPGPITTTQTYTGILEPGLYTFSSSWSTPEVIYYDGGNTGLSNIAGVTAALSVSGVAVPEPASLGLIGLVGLGLMRRNRQPV
jgi:hypothetical protein